MSEHDLSFLCMGTTIRLLVGPSLEPGGRSPEEAASAARDYLSRFDRDLSRFRADSALCALNRDPRETVPASRLVRAAVTAALWAAQQTGGLVDPTLIGALEDAGYAESRAGLRASSLRDALTEAPPRRPARPDPGSAWRDIEVDEDEGVVRRAPGVRLDSGGTGKGLAADAVASMLRGHSRFVVDCGGDMRIGGPSAAVSPYEVEVEHPLTRETTHVLRIGSGAVATSGIDSRLWHTDAGPMHHLLDPSTGRPAWTGLVGVTALAPTALAAETLAKAALLSGPLGAREILSAEGGLMVHDSGEVETAGPLSSSERPRVRLPRPAAAIAGMA